MARSYGALKVAVWEAGSDFRNLTHLAQWAYVLLISQPQLNNLGVLPYTPEKWIRFAAGLSHETLESGLGELDQLRYIVIDLETGELLVRTFIKHDKVWQQPSLITNARKLIREVESDRIRGLLTARHPWLLTSETRDAIEAYELSVENVETSQEETPVETGVETPLGPRARAGPGPGPGVGAAAKVSSSSSSSVASYVETEDPENPAAVVAAATEQEILAACTRFGAEPNIAEPWARQLTGDELQAIVVKMEMKIRRGTVEHPPAQFVDLLKRRVAANVKAASAVTIRIPSLEEVLHNDAVSYARGRHPWDVASELLGRKMTKLAVPAERRDDLLAVLRNVYDENAEAA